MVDTVGQTLVARGAFFEKAEGVEAAADVEKKTVG